MIDIENELFSSIAGKLRVTYPGIFVSSEIVRAPAIFPAVIFREISNSVYERTQTNWNVENHVQLGYEVNVYSNKVEGKKSECKAIIRTIDEDLSALGFLRTSLEPIDNLADPSIMRFVARYKAVVSKDKTIYRR